MRENQAKLRGDLKDLLQPFDYWRIEKTLAGFWTPTGQDRDADGIARFFQENETVIRIGMVLSVIAMPCCYTCSIAA